MSHLGLNPCDNTRLKYQTSTARYDWTRFLSDCFNSVFTTDTFYTSVLDILSIVLSRALQSEWHGTEVIVR